ncbi:MAG: ankyrin repeat domain-containing protein [Acidobacteriota bacterium]
MSHKKRSYRYLWLAIVIIIGGGFNSSTSSALQQVDPDSVSINALTEAAMLGDSDEVRRLIKMGVDVNLITDNEATPLILASQNGHAEIVRLLLDAGANANANPFKYTPHSDYEVSYTPADLLPVVHQSEIVYEATALHTASRNGHTEIVKLLLEAGANVDATGNDDVTALHAASQNGHAEIVELLLEAGANVNAEITRAFYREQDHLLESMRGPEPISPPMAVLNYHTPLMLAAQNGYIEIVELLLDAGAKVDIETYAGTAEGVASQNGHAEIVKLLLEAWANADAKARD